MEILTHSGNDPNTVYKEKGSFENAEIIISGLYYWP